MTYDGTFDDDEYNYDYDYDYETPHIETEDEDETQTLDGSVSPTERYSSRASQYRGAYH